MTDLYDLLPIKFVLLNPLNPFPIPCLFYNTPNVLEYSKLFTQAQHILLSIFSMHSPPTQSSPPSFIPLDKNAHKINMKIMCEFLLARFSVNNNSTSEDWTVPYSPSLHTQ